MKRSSLISGGAFALTLLLSILLLVWASQPILTAGTCQEGAWEGVLDAGTMAMAGVVVRLNKCAPVAGTVYVIEAVNLDLAAKWAITPASWGGADSLILRAELPGRQDVNLRLARKGRDFCGVFKYRYHTQRAICLKRLD